MIKCLIINSTEGEYVPETTHFYRWANAIKYENEGEVTIKIITPDEMRGYNKLFKNQDKVSDTLAFPADNIIIENKVILGDIAMCASKINSDSELYNKKKLERLVEQYNLSNEIRFIEKCEYMPAAYMISDIVISPSIEPEAFGRVSVEAQSMKKPIIASNIGGSNETIIDNKTGILFESGNADSLSQKINEIINLDALTLELMGKEGRKNVINRFNIEKMCLNTYSEYKKLFN